MTSLTVERLTTEAEMTALVPEWEVLDANLSPRVPFTSPLWNTLWWRHFRRQGLSFHDQLRVYALRDPDSRHLVAVAPMMVSHRPSLGPLRLRELQFPGADSNMTELRGIVCRASDLARVTMALGNAMREDQPYWDWVQWRGLRITTEVTDWASQIAGFEPSRTLPLYLLRLPETWDIFRGSLPRNVKEAIRKCYNAPVRDGLDLLFTVVERPADMTAAVDRFLTLHKRRAAAPMAVMHPDIFAKQRASAFVHDYAAAMAERRMVRLFELRVAGMVVASRVGFVLGEDLYLYFSGYEPKLGQYSVMTRLLTEIIKWAIANGFKIANLSSGQDVSKTRWRPEAIYYHEGVKVAPTRRGKLAFAVMHRLRQRQLRVTSLRRN